MKKIIAVMAAFVILAGAHAAFASDAVNAGNKVCPVTGQPIDAQVMEPVLYEYDGKVYNLCCGGCIGKFKDDPQAYVQKVNDELKAEASH